MKYDDVGEKSLLYSAEDECGNEANEPREVIVARNVVGGEGITVTQEGATATVSLDGCYVDCDTLDNYKDQVTALLEEKQDVLTKADLLEILGYEELLYVQTNDNNTSKSVYVLGRVVEG